MSLKLHIAHVSWNTLMLRHGKLSFNNYNTKLIKWFELMGTIASEAKGKIAVNSQWNNVFRARWWVFGTVDCRWLNIFWLSNCDSDFFFLNKFLQVILHYFPYRALNGFIQEDSRFPIWTNQTLNITCPSRSVCIFITKSVDDISLISFNSHRTNMQRNSIVIAPHYLSYSCQLCG